MSQLDIAKSADVNAQVVNYSSTVSTKAGNVPLNLKMELNYDNSLSNAPIAVVMHPYSGATGHFNDYRAVAQDLRAKGFFTVMVAMRGREGSDGTRDSGGLEIYDIYDAVEYVKANYSGMVDENSVIIEGFSGGGGNVMSAITKLPDYFKAAGAYFGMSDYGYDAQDGWYQNGAGARTSQLNADIGNPNTGGAAVLDKYLARNSAMASMNNPYTDIHLFVNGVGETICPPINNYNYLNFAVANQSFVGEFDNINLHIGVKNTYYDHNGNSINDLGEEQWFPHMNPEDYDGMHEAGYNWYIKGVLDGTTLAPVLNNSDTLFVAGFVKTKKFESWLGDGQNAAGELEYNLGIDSYQFQLELMSSDLTKTGWVEVDLSEHLGELWQFYRNGVLEDTFTANGKYRMNNFMDGQTLLLQAVPEPGLAAMAGVGAALLAAGGRRRRRES
jgi:hypothetical protein